MGGDWNATLSYLDKSGGFPWRETVHRNGLESLMADLNLVDVYRTLHRKTKAYTYETKIQKLKSRIDYFIIAKQLINQVKKKKHDPHLLPIVKLSF